jgi:hypothetical protein
MPLGMLPNLRRGVRTFRFAWRSHAPHVSDGEAAVAVAFDIDATEPEFDRATTRDANLTMRNKWFDQGIVRLYGEARTARPRTNLLMVSKSTGMLVPLFRGPAASRQKLPAFH